MPRYPDPARRPRPAVTLNGLARRDPDVKVWVPVPAGRDAAQAPELPRVRSWLDPWWLAGLAALALLGWRTVWALRRKA